MKPDFYTSHVYVVNWATFRQLLLKPKKAPGWLFVHLIKWVYGLVR